MLRPVYDEADGADGFVSIEVEPDLADDADGTLASARGTCGARLARPNVFVKIPATAAGLPAIEHAIADGINVNITLMFSVDVYRSRGARVHRRARAAACERGEDVSQVASVASFFVSRVDTKVDKQLEEIGTPMRRWPLRGTAAIANAKLAYERLPGDLRRRRVRRAARGGRAGAALPVGEHLDQEPRLSATSSTSRS